MNKELKNYYAAIENLTKLFCKRYFKEYYEYNDNDWVGGDIGGIISINDYFFLMEDIAIAIKHNATKKELLDYYDYSVEKGLNGQDRSFSFETYLKYFRGFSFEEIEVKISNKNNNY